MRHRVTTVIADGISPFEFAIAVEVFGIDRTDVLGVPWYDFRVASNDRRVVTKTGFAIEATHGLDAVADADTVIVPVTPDPVHALTPAYLDALRDAHARGARMVSFCTGAFALAEAGLLDGRPATTHWLYAEEFARRYPAVDLHDNVLFVDDGDILTGAGTASGIDLSLHVVRKDHGADVADRVARRMVVPPHREGGQAQFIETPREPRCDGDEIAPLLDWVQGHLARPLTVDDLAAKLGMSPRTFARRFREATGTTPHRWLVQQRVARARRLLETTDLDVERVADRSGLGTSANLREHFRRELGVPPSSYRRTFARTGPGIA